MESRLGRSAAVRRKNGAKAEARNSGRQWIAPKKITIIFSMTTDISIIIKPEDEKNQEKISQELMSALAKKGIRAKKEDVTAVFVKKSIDARHGQIKILLRYEIYIGEKPNGDGENLPVWKKADGKHSVIIIGSGPAGLYASFRLLEKGVKPIVIERGASAEERKNDVWDLKSQGKLNAQSNFCFGEGGAGTFSDGKLYTRSNKRGDIGKIYRIFVEFGANEKILTDAHPHIGTDKLPGIISGMRKKIIELGGEFHFNTLCTDIITEKKDGCLQAKGVKIKNLKNGQESQLEGDAVILASGHSATDIYKMMAKIAPQCLEAKTFAVGVRVEHPRSLIDAIQFHGKPMAQAAEYRLTAQENDRGVYSFCMCPGGYVVPCATAENQIVINGMSASGRNSQWSNAAIVVERRPEDIPEKFIKEAENDGCPALAGLYWRTWLEEETFRQGRGQFAPAQKLTDFLSHKASSDLPPSSYKPGLVASRLDLWLPEEISSRLQAGFRDFDKNMKGFVCDDALLIAMETRTSTPVRIVRDKESLECSAIKNLYPCGEGSGYSGGIGSSAMDGEKVGGRILEKLGL